jgi:hypothetical protein
LRSRRGSTRSGSSGCGGTCEGRDAATNRRGRGAGTSTCGTLQMRPGAKRFVRLASARTLRLCGCRRFAQRERKLGIREICFGAGASTLRLSPLRSARTELEIRETCFGADASTLWLPPLRSARTGVRDSRNLLRRWHCYSVAVAPARSANGVSGFAPSPLPLVPFVLSVATKSQSRSTRAYINAARPAGAAVRSSRFFSSHACSGCTFSKYCTSPPISAAIVTPSRYKTRLE